MTADSEFDSIRPYYGDEVEAAVKRLCQSSEFMILFSRLTGMGKELIIKALEGIKTREEFQKRFFVPAIKLIISSTTDGVTSSGLEQVKPDTSYLFMSDHRDIILDSAILNVLLQQSGNKYTQAAIGSNLLINEWVTDLVKLDSCFVIERDITVREMLSSSAIRSRYIHQIVEQNEYSVWIAQREGRTKNGDDRTQPSLLKMLKMSGNKDFIQNFSDLHIMPLSISYEWEPCDALKTEELYTKTLGEYVKTPETDMNSMLTGLSDYKGRVHFHIDRLEAEELEEIGKLPSNGERIEALAQAIDRKIHKNFKLWPNNYIAYDLLHSVTKFSPYYTQEEKENFIRVMTQKIDKLNGNLSMLNNIYLEIYANPVKNSLNL